MNILILTDPFGPPSFAPRMRHLATNLSKKGWKVSVCTEQMPGVDFQTTDFELFQMPYYSANTGIKHNIQWLLDKLFNLKEKRFLSFVTRHVTPADYDWILCSTFSDFPLRTAYLLSQKQGIPLAVDLRDIVEQWGDTSYTSGHHLIQRLFRHCYEYRALRLRNKVIQVAQFVTTVSPWHKQTIQPYHPQTHLIYNGFDANDLIPVFEQTPQFIISYTGRIYDFRLRDPRPLFKAIRLLLEAHPQIRKTLSVQFYIEPDCHRQVWEAIQHEHIEDVCQIESFIPPYEAMQRMRQSAIGLILTNKPSKHGPFGIMTTKFFEILGLEKPALCIPSDEGVLSEVINLTHAGLASGDVFAIRDFIFSQYQDWLKQGYTHQKVRNKELFTRQHQAQQFEQLFLSLCQK